MVVCLRNGTRVVVGLLTVFLAVASLSAQTTPSSGPAERSGPSDEATSLPADSLEMEGDAEASETDQEIVQNRRLPVLKGHRFIPTSTVPDPFVTIYLRSNTGFGFLLDARFPVITEADTVGVVEGDIAFALLGFEYQQAIVDFLAVRIGFGGAVRTGTNGGTLLAEGLSARYSFEIGVTGRVFRTESLLLSAVADFSSNKLIAIDPFGFAQRVADECSDAPDVS